MDTTHLRTWCGCFGVYKDSRDSKRKLWGPSAPLPPQHIPSGNKVLMSSLGSMESDHSTRHCSQLKSPYERKILKMHLGTSHFYRPHESSSL
ncbi:hypothetical protein CapIbe_014029 [Capra ibex]